MAEDDVRETHESYALLGITRVSCGSVNLFGSAIPHQQLYRLRIKRAELVRRMHADDYRATPEALIEVDLSIDQFAEAITSVGMGDGVPCTITRLGGRQISRPPRAHKRQQFVDEFQRYAKQLGRQFDQVLEQATEMVERPAVSKQERRQLLERLNQLRTILSSSMPFLAQQFDEHVEKMAHTIQQEVVARIQAVQPVSTGEQLATVPDLILPGPDDGTT